MISSRLPGRYLSSRHTVAFLSKNVVSHPYPSILHTLKPGSQYIACDVSRPEVILFSMGFDASCRKNRNRGLTKTRTGPDPRTRLNMQKIHVGI